MSQRKPLIRRTFLQERYEILIKRQQNGTATFNELTELDDIVNRDPSIREIVLIENHFIDGPEDNNETNTDAIENIVKPANLNWLSKLRAYIGRIFILHASIAGEKAVITL
ncbi:MAG: hypothetical protein M3O71_11265 [Bacteroidota bacterium]|nr:hypothetical protein [Bacteroidota bacterium]